MALKKVIPEQDAWEQVRFLHTTLLELGRTVLRALVFGTLLASFWGPKTMVLSKREGLLPGPGVAWSLRFLFFLQLWLLYFLLFWSFFWVLSWLQFCAWRRVGFLRGRLVVFFVAVLAGAFVALLVAVLVFAFV